MTFEFISEVYLEPFGVSGRDLAEPLDVAASTLSRVRNGVSLGDPIQVFRNCGASR